MQTSLEDIFLWPDGEWCYRENIEDFAPKSDDYEIVPVNSEKWNELVGNL